MTEKPETTGTPHLEENETLAAFRATLSTLTKEYADNKYVTYGIPHDPKENAQKMARAKELRLQLIDTCAQALATIPGAEATMQVIHEVVIRYVHGVGTLLLAGADIGEFWRELALAVAQKSQEK